MKNEQGIIIYVGKAKVLKNRVRSYFTGSHDGKTQKLISEIWDFEYIVTPSDAASLILECNLIKAHSPRYNVLLKDDKSFPYIKITNEKFPRLEVTRRVLNDRAKYFGPYPNAFAARETKRLLDRLYPLRKCINLPDRVCLYYHMKQCVGPCVHKIDPRYFVQLTSEIRHFLNGGQGLIKKELVRKMEEAADALQFERAKEYREQIRAIDALMDKQTINIADGKDRDVFGFAIHYGWMCVHILYMRQGKIIQRHMTTFAFYGHPYEDFICFITQYYSENPALPKEILLPFPGDHEAFSARKDKGKSCAESSADLLVSLSEHQAKFLHSSGEEIKASEVVNSLKQMLKRKIILPRRGLKRKLVNMACDNAQLGLEEKIRLLERDEARTKKAAIELAHTLGIPSASRIEAFDNSNIQGTSAVSAMIVFVEGKPSKKEYRKYHIRTVKGPDDYDSMREVIRRRYERLLKEGLPLPDLIVIDGGKNHINTASAVLIHELGLDIPVCGLAKDKKHRTSQLLMGNPPEVVDLPRNSQTFNLLQRIQNEVHRFAVTFHRKTRSNTMLTSQLDQIAGIGEKRRQKLLRHFGSLKAIKEASPEDFKKISIGEKQAHFIQEALNKEKE